MPLYMHVHAINGGVRIGDVVPVQEGA